MRKGEFHMMQKIKHFPMMAYFAVSSFVQDFRKDQRGLEVVQVVLIILVGVVLIGILMWLLRDWLADLWEQITGTNVTEGTGGGF
jgi:Flp pilus assembly pilin Flp